MKLQQCINFFLLEREEEEEEENYHAIIINFSQPCRDNLREIYAVAFVEV